MALLSRRLPYCSIRYTKDTPRRMSRMTEMGNLAASMGKGPNWGLAAGALVGKQWLMTVCVTMAPFAKAKAHCTNKSKFMVVVLSGGRGTSGGEPDKWRARVAVCVCEAG